VDGVIAFPVTGGLGSEEVLHQAAELRRHLVVPVGEAHGGARPERTLGHEITEEDCLVLGEVIGAHRLLGSEEGRDHDVSHLEVADVAPYDGAPLVEDPERVVVGGGDRAPGPEPNPADGTPVVVGEVGDRLELATLVDGSHPHPGHVGHPGGARRRLPAPLEDLGHRLEAVIGPDVGVGGETLPAALWTVYLHDPAAGHAPDAERQVEGQGTGRDDVDLAQGVRAHLHDGALAELSLDLGDGHLESLVAFHRCSFLSAHRGPYGEGVTVSGIPTR
jgi:hypothetical protein